MAFKKINAIVFYRTELEYIPGGNVLAHPETAHCSKKTWEPYLHPKVFHNIHYRWVVTALAVVSARAISLLNLLMFVQFVAQAPLLLEVSQDRLRGTRSVPGKTRG